MKKVIVLNEMHHEIIDKFASAVPKGATNTDAIVSSAFFIAVTMKSVKKNIDVQKVTQAVLDLVINILDESEKEEEAKS